MPLAPRLRRAFAVFAEVFGYWAKERRTLRQGFSALAISTGVGMAAGVVLGFMEELLAALPGLLVLVPAAIGMRGAIFGALAARLGTGILTGQFERELRRDGFAAQNIEASALLTIFSSGLSAVAARAVAAALGLPTIDVWQLMVVSMVGGILSSLVIVVVVLLLALQAESRNWDMDAIGAPLVTTVGDIVTLPALIVGTFLIGNELFATSFGALLLVCTVAAVVYGLRNPWPIARRVVTESIPALSYAAIVNVLAGGVLEARIEGLISSPALLVLIPPFIANCGSLGGILAARLATDLHLGLITPRRLPQKQASLQGSLTMLFALAAFTGVGLIAHVASAILGFDSPGLPALVGIALTGGIVSVGLLFAVSYYTATLTYRFGFDPDNHGIPIVTATMDLLGVLCLIAAMALFGVI